MKLIIILYMLLISTVLKCSKTEEPTPDNIQASPITAVAMPEQAAVGEAVSIEVTFMVHNGCGRFKNFDVLEVDGNTVVNVHAEYVGEACTEALRYIKETYTFTPTTAGTRTFRFWTGSTSPYITKTLIVR